MNTLSEAVELLVAERVLMLAPHPPLRSLVEAIAGSGTSGNWWGHRKGGQIFNVSTALADHPDTLVVKLVAGKITFVHRSLWPHVLRASMDSSRRAERVARLGTDAQRLLARVATEGTVPAEKSDKAARSPLEKSLLVLAQSVHTERGNHHTILTSWDAWSRSVGVAADPGTLANSFAELTRACRGAKLSL